MGRLFRATVFHAGVGSECTLVSSRLSYEAQVRLKLTSPIRYAEGHYYIGKS